MADLLEAATVFGLAVSELEARLWTVLLQKGQLFGIDGTTSFLSNEFNGIFIFHAEFNQSQGDQDGCSTKSGYAMHGHTQSVQHRTCFVGASQTTVRPLRMGGRCRRRSINRSLQSLPCAFPRLCTSVHILGLHPSRRASSVPRPC